MFVHRNIANLVVHTDINMLSVVQYAVEVLKVKHLIVCGHYGCGGVKAAATTQRFGLIDNWLRNIKDVIRFHEAELNRIYDKKQKEDRMVELNAIEQVHNLCKTDIVMDAWDRGQMVKVHGWVYDLETGKLKNLDVTCESQKDVVDRFSFDL